VIQINNVSRPTQYVSANELRTTLTAADLSVAGSLNIRVVNPEPGGGNSVNALPFTITPPGQNPIPSIDYLAPQSAAAGGPAFTLIVKGANFVNDSQVRWNGVNRTTIFVNSGEVRTTVTAADLLNPGPAAVTVFNPGPGGGASNAVAFQVAAPGQNPAPSIASLAPNSVIARGAQSQPLQVTIQGQGFLPESQAHWNGANRATTYVSSTQLRVTLRTQYDDALPPTRANPEQLHQVFLNLGKNALQAMAEGGTLIIATRLVRRGRRPGNWIEVSFRDTGEGISPENLKSLFIPFFTTKGGGSGLGLPISQRIAENHGGTLRVHSTPGKGSTFTLVIPQTTGDSSTAS
jgi:hypothetical protein